MTVQILLPELGESVTEATVTAWFKDVGDFVKEGEALLEVSTDKVDSELPSPVTGTVTSIDVGVDENVVVGALLATVSGETPAQAGPSDDEAVSRPDLEVKTFDVNVEGPAPLSVLAKSQAEARGVDLSGLAGSGLAGRIRLTDVSSATPTLESLTRSPYVFVAPVLHPLPALDAPDSAAVSDEPDGEERISPNGPDVETRKLSRLRATIARRMTQSLQTSAQLTSVVEIDVTPVDEARRQHGEKFMARNGVKLSFTPFFAAAAVRALASHPVLNASISEDLSTATYHQRVHLGIAVDTERGLLAPVVRNADDLTLDALARSIVDMADRTRSGSVTVDELNGGTFTLTNTGSRGTLFDTPIINQPQVAILGTGAVVKRPVVLTKPSYGDTISVRSMVHFALTYDHRLVDGADAARYLGAIKAMLEDPSFSRTMVGASVDEL